MDSYSHLPNKYLYNNYAAGDLCLARERSGSTPGIARSGPSTHPHLRSVRYKAYKIGPKKQVCEKKCYISIMTKE